MDDTLKIGSQGDPVRELQSQLKVLGYFLADVSGDFDAATAKAVADFQTERTSASTAPESDSLTMALGTFDEATSRALHDHLSLRLGAMHCLGFLTDDGPRSSAEALDKALRSFQASEHIATSGILDHATRRALSNQIESLQSKLYFLGHYKGFVDGSFNPFIIPAIREFQTRHHLLPSGIRDPATALKIVQNAVITPDQGEPLDRAKQDKVIAIQRKLGRSGHYRGGQHGRYDNATVTALIAFQQKHKLPRTDGFCDDRTWWQLNQDSGTIFSEVFQWELDALDEEGSDVIPDKADPRPAAESEVIARAHKNQLFGLAFSGGGIRSATFNLGMSQALAEKQLLREFHYLSTVSGGGYIGSWLSKWIHEERGEIGAVEAKLAIEQRQTADKAEPDQIKFLRQYSNYLTPQLGLFGADTWSVIATYVRNVMLNMSILVAGISFVMLVPRLLLWLVTQYSNVAQTDELYTPDFAFWFGGIALTAFLVAVFFISLNISLVAHPRNQQHWLYCQEQGCVLNRVVAPLMISGFCGSIWLWYEYELAQVYLLNFRYLLISTIIYLTVWGIAWWLGQLKNKKNEIQLTHSGGIFRQIRPHLAFSLISLIIGHCLIKFVLGQFHDLTTIHDSLNHPVNLVAFGMPVALSIFGITMILLVGLLGRAYSDRSREWWSRMGGWTVIFTIGWVVLFAICLYGPPFVTWINHEVSTWVSSTITLSWLLTTIAGVVYGKSAASDAKPKGRSSERLIAIAPPLFVLGLLLLTTVVIQQLTGVADLCVTNNRTLGEYLSAGFCAAEATPITILLAGMAGCAVVAVALAWRVDINKFSMYMMYRNRLVRCYLGASTVKRHPHPFVGFDAADDPHLAQMLWKKEASNAAVHHLQKPFHLINTALNLVGGKELAWQERKAASFTFSPGYCGFELPDRPGRLEPNDGADIARGCFRTTREYGAGELDSIGGTKSASGLRNKLERYRDEEEGIKLGQAMAISGAAASPNMGYHSNPALSFLMTAFNVRLGRWSANPRQDSWRSSSPRFGLTWLISELFGLTNADSHFVYLSDGGHFENLGIYELVRRRCALIVVIDASGDPDAGFSDLGGAIRKCFTDFGVEIDIRVNDNTIDRATHLAKSHWAIGEIKYGLVDEHCNNGVPGCSGLLLYIKPSLTGNEPADIFNYRNIDANFPHQSTADQWFDETQFESYRKLGYHIGRSVLSDICAALDHNHIVGGERRQALLTLLYDKFKAAQSSAKVGTT